MELRSALTEAKTTNGRSCVKGLRVVGRRRRHRVHAAHPAGHARRTSRLLPARAVRSRRIGRPGRPARPRRTTVTAHAGRDAAWLRQELASTQAVPPVHRRRAGGRQSGAARGARGSAVEQRGAAEHERRARDHQGGTAVRERGADDGQRAVPQPQSRARRADGRPVELHQQRRSADGHGRTGSAHSSTDARRPDGPSTCCRPTSGDRLEHIKFSLAVEGLGDGHRAGDRARCSRGSARCATATAGGGCCACCRSAPPTIGSTARRSWPSTSI